MPTKLRCTLLCEDLEQERLFRPLLERLGGRVRVESRKPTGGAAFVLSCLGKAATYVRQRPREAVGLLVVIDGDDVGLRGRLREIQQRLQTVGFDVGRQDDRIASCIPSRNVETWELWLHGRRDLDESTDYKLEAQRQLKNVRPKTLVDAWFAQASKAQREAEEACLPALAHGRQELERLQGVGS